MGNKKEDKRKYRLVYYCDVLIYTEIESILAVQAEIQTLQGIRKIVP